jgi:uncharacterized protein
MKTAMQPTASASRQQSIDILRGFAVLGILLMNIQTFSMIQASYFNPTAYGSLEGINYLVWAFQHVFSDQKFMTIFSALFGTGMVLMANRAEARGVSATALHYRRMFWLLCLGAAHAYLIWAGDILVVYALCGFIVVWMRKRRPLTQFVVGLLMLAVGSCISLMGGFSFDQWPAEAVEEQMRHWTPHAEAVAREVAAYRGNWLDQMEFRVPQALEFHTEVIFFWAFWRAGGLMVIGMALYRWGLFSARLSRNRYLLFTILGLGLGLPLIVYGLQRHEALDWDYANSMLLSSQFNYWGSLLVSLAYTSLVMLWFLGGRFKGLSRRLSAVGRMAFTNYILQSLICTLLFYGHGLGWFGHAERWQQLLVVFAVWAVILLLSPWWLARFRYGPLEWLWRSLTYWQRQPMRQSMDR